VWMANERPSMRGVRLSGPFNLGERPEKSGLEHSPESVGISGKGERPNAVSCGDFPYFCLHSEGTEENGQGASIPDGVHQVFAVRVITIDHDCLEGLAGDGVLDRLITSQEPRLQTTKLYH
jgi:hypothetical protein